ncbi:hypothetical protein B0H16DRAFT_1788829 [Mycena metata]|uniref:Uncharacterized protein n=1 Tax=Mycena metata TaxID=1033252 RepID=A0AAD7HLF3_9AGAR|nr:hypothetical protein B0H16DRAFT_1788829 [Mycena metata]
MSSGPSTSYVYATGPAPPYHEHLNGSIVAPALIYNPPPPPSQQPQALPEITPTSAFRWARLRNISNPAMLSYFEDGRLLNANAAAFHPARGTSISRSASSSTSSGSSPMSISSAATSVSTGLFSRNQEPPRTAGLHATPVELNYNTYLNQLRAAVDPEVIIRDMLEAGVADWKHTHHIANFATHLAMYARSDNFTQLFRRMALAMFDSYWRDNDGPWRYERNTHSEYLISRGVNIAALMGSFFRHGLINGVDVHTCLGALLHNGRSFLKLQVIHALLVHCGERVCFGETGAATQRLLASLKARGPDGRLLWGPHEESNLILEDLFNYLQNCFSSAEMAQIMANAR